MCSSLKDYPHGNYPVSKEQLTLANKEETIKGLKQWKEWKKRAVLEAI